MPKETLQGLQIKPGMYTASIVDAFDGQSQASGADMTTVAFEIQDDGAGKGQCVWDHFVQNHPDGERRMMDLLAALSLQGQDEVETQELIK